MGLRRGVRRFAPAAPEAGMVTAELAVALPVLVLVAVVATAGLQLAVAQLRCLDAASVAARLAGRGEAATDVTAGARAAAPPGATVRMRRDGDLVAADVTVVVHALGLGRLLPGFAVAATAVSFADQPRDGAP
jgi:hypothetical protein